MEDNPPTTFHEILPNLVERYRSAFSPRELAKGLAARLPLRLLETAANYAVLRERPDLLPSAYVIRDRTAYFARVSELIGGPDIPLTFLEFGVHKGASLRHWLELNRNPASCFIGFDSFVGLPEPWRGRPAGYFDCRGEPPRIDDDRVRFVRGWFNETVRPELDGLGRDGTILVHIDADLHSAAVYLLVALGQALGRFAVMFDEFGAGEARALRDVLAAFGGGFEPVLGLKRTPSALPTRVFGQFCLGAAA